MIRWIGVLASLAIVAFWAWTNTQLLVREYQLRNLDLYQRGVTRFLGNELAREHWMSIHRKNEKGRLRKVGYTGFKLERRFEDDGVHHDMTLESRAELDLFGQKRQIEVRGTVVADRKMIPERLDMEIILGDQGTRLEGERRDDSFVLLANGLEIPFPLKELGFGNGLGVDVPVAGFEVGQTYELPAFDPVSHLLPGGFAGLTKSRGIAKVEVKEETDIKINGTRVHCFHLETRYLGRTYESWVTPEGRTLRQELPAPMDCILISESTREQAVGIFDRRH